MRAARPVDGGEAVLAGEDVVDVELRRNTQLEIDGLEAGGAAEQIEAEAEVLEGGELIATAEEAGVAALGAVRTGGHGNAARLEQRLAGAGEVEEEAAAENGI